MDEIEQLRQAIAAQQSLRGTLDDAIIDATVASLREKLANLTRAQPHEQQRKLVTVMFADVSGFTAMSETMDAEDVNDIMNELWQRIDATVIEHGGTIDKHIGDAVMALWGAEASSERDPDRAVRAALDMQAAVHDFRQERQLDLELHIGINSGPALLGPVGTTGEFTAIGDTVNTASRLEDAAPRGCILISHDTYWHVQGAFDVAPQEPVLVKGKQEALQVYRVLRARPHSFRSRRRGVEGIATRMIGRHRELSLLQELFTDACADSERTVTTVVGEAGVGKSRLLYEFQQWADGQANDVRIYRGRARQEMQSLPFGLLRELFAQHFAIGDDDPSRAVEEKLAAGLIPTRSDDSDESPSSTGSPSERKAHFIGHLLGFEFHESPYLGELKDNPQAARDQGLAYLAEYFARAAVTTPVLLLIEDLHWADGSSLDALSHVLVSVEDRQLLAVTTTRPHLFERRPHWFEGRSFHRRMDLEPLSRRDSRRLVDEVLQKVANIPAALREKVVSDSEGNPFYVEELIKMFVEQGVIVKAEPRWQVVLEKLDTTSVPPTLTEVLQARLDSLPVAERTLLQQASVVGRVFWDKTVIYFNQADADAAGNVTPLAEEAVEQGLLALRDKEMIFRREQSTFAATREYIFKHAVLRDVTYETVLKRARRRYHALAAAWLEDYSSDRAQVLAGLVADHLDSAGKVEESLHYLLRAGDRAVSHFAYEEAASFYKRALRRQREMDDDHSAAQTLMKLGSLYHTTLRFDDAHRAYEEAFALHQNDVVPETGTSTPPTVPAHPLRVMMRVQNTLDPIHDTLQLPTEILAKQVFTGLVEVSASGEPLPEAASSWDVLDGGRRYLFNLRRDAHWSDGTPVTAHDFAFAWKRALDPSRGAWQARLLHEIKGARSFAEGRESDASQIGIRVHSDYLLEVEQEAPTGYFLAMLGQLGAAPVPRHVIEAQGDTWATTAGIVGNGPFRVEAWQHGQQLVLARNPLYVGQRAGNVEKIVVSDLHDMKAEDAYRRYEQGELDILHFVGSYERQRQARLKSDADFHEWPNPSTYYVGFNVSRPPLDDRRVRMALALAVDREAYVSQATEGMVRPAWGGFLPPSIPGHRASSALAFDPERARSLLAEAGYPGGAGLPTLEFIRPDDYNYQVRQEILCSLWEQNLHVACKVVAGTFDEYYKGLDAAVAHMWVEGWAAEFPDPDCFLRAAWQQQSRWHHSEYESLVNSARRSLNHQERLEMYGQAEQILLQEVPILPLNYGAVNVLVQSWIRQAPLPRNGIPHWKDAVIQSH